MSTSKWPPPEWGIIDNWTLYASEIVNEQAFEERAHPLMISDRPEGWYIGDKYEWLEGASTILEEQALEEEVQKIAE